MQRDRLGGPEGEPIGEPAALARGKLFHRRLQESWRLRHGGIGEPRIEKELRGVLGKRARPDIQVDLATGEGPDANPQVFIALLEAKSRDFASLSRASVRRLISRDRRQVLRYVDQLFAGLSGDAAAPIVEIAASLIYETGPASGAGRAEVEAFLDEAGIGVIWEDETVEEARARLLETPRGHPRSPLERG